MKFNIVQNALFALVIVILTLSGYMRTSSDLAMGLVSLYFASVGNQLSVSMTEERVAKHGRYNQKDAIGWIWTVFILVAVIFFSIKSDL